VYNVFKDDEDGLERAVRAALDAPLLDRCVAFCHHNLAARADC
jgi:hypothetical protein